MVRKLSYCLITLFFLTTYSTALAQEKMAVTGMVRDGSNMSPVAGASVNAVKNGTAISSVLSDSAGRFIFYELPPGEVELNVSAKGYQLQRLGRQQIVAGKPISVMVDLTRDAGGIPVVDTAEITITGTITDSTGKTITGANIVLEGTQVGTVSNLNGVYVINGIVGKNLVFSFTGYQPQTVFISPGMNKVDVVLNAALVTGLEEVVVAAFGRTQRKEATVGAVTSIEPEKLKIPASNLTNALAGQLAGIIAYQPSGQPGYDNSQFFIRGVTTFGYSNRPLILIDNIESTPTDLARLQVDDIATFSLLRDASATALYGARGANGVLLVTTKKGVADKPTLTGRFENSFSSPTKTLELADPITYMTLFNEAQTTRDPLAVPRYDANKLFNTRQTVDNAPGSNPYVYPAVDWLNTLFKKHTSNQRANLNIRGGGNIAQYYISGAYNLDNGILKVDPRNNFNNNVKLQNYQLRSNVDVNVTKTTKLKLLLSGVFDEYNGPITSDPSGATDLYDRVMHANPVLFPASYAPDSANGFSQHILFGNSSINGRTSLFDNPYAGLLRGYSQFTRSTMNAQLNLVQDLDFITPGLNFSGIFNTRRFSYYAVNRQYLPFYYEVRTYEPVSNVYALNWINNQPGEAREYLDFDRQDNSLVESDVYLQGVLSYARDFDKHGVDASLVGTRQQILNSNLSTDGNTALASSLPARNLNIAGQVSYTYDRRYVVQTNFGYNGSERFSAENRFGFFPTVGVAWNVNNEKFWKGNISNIINKLKFRGSYGLVGNDAISSVRFFYLSGVTLNNGSPASFGVTNGFGLGGVNISNYPNPDVTWETSKQTNLGMDISFFRSLNIVLDVYKERRYNIYMNRLAVASQGLEAAVGANIGSATSKGLALQMDYSKSISKDLNIGGRANLTMSQAQYDYFEEPDYPGEPWRRRTGSTIGQGFGYIAERLFVDDNEAQNAPSQIFTSGSLPPQGGDIKYRDVNGDGQITVADMVPIGYPTVPQVTYGFGLSTRYKSFDLNIFCQGNAQTSFFINAGAVSPFVNNTQVLKAFADDHWSEDNQSLYALYPRLGTTAAAINNNTQTSTWWMRDGSFMRIKSVQLGYTVPNNWISRYHITNCRLYFDGLNLFTFSKFKEWDIEQGGNAFAYPIQRVLNVGVNFSFK